MAEAPEEEQLDVQEEDVPKEEFEEELSVPQAQVDEIDVPIEEEISEKEDQGPYEEEEDITVSQIDQDEGGPTESADEELPSEQAIIQELEGEANALEGDKEEDETIIEDEIPLDSEIQLEEVREESETETERVMPEEENFEIEELGEIEEVEIIEQLEEESEKEEVKELEEEQEEEEMVQVFDSEAKKKPSKAIISLDDKRTREKTFESEGTPLARERMPSRKSIRLVMRSDASTSSLKRIHMLYLQDDYKMNFENFPWPAYYNEDRDQIYENLLAITVCNSNLMVLPKDHCLIRHDHKTMVNKVKILGGGRAGSDPLFSGFIGKGMLTAAVIGDRIEAPKVQSVYNLIQELAYDHKPGILILVQNCYEYRLVFGIALQRAKQLGILVEMVTVSDDCFEQDRTEAGRLGLAGILLAIKIAGGMSEQGKHMKDILMVCRTHLMATISGYVLPNEFRIGSRIDPEGGISLELTNLKQVITWMLAHLTHPCRLFSVPLKPLNHVVLLINMYTQDWMFMSSILTETIRQLYIQDVDVLRSYAGNFITSSERERGFSITLLKVYDEFILKWLDEPTSAEAWPVSKSGQTPLIKKSIAKLPVGKLTRSGIKFNQQTKRLIPHILNYVCRAILEAETIMIACKKTFYLGSAIVRGATAIAHLNRTQTVELKSAFCFLQQIAHTLEKSMGGATGAMFALMFDGAAEKIYCYPREEELTPYMWSQALKRGIETLITFAGYREDHCTILDALFPAYEVCKIVPKEVDGVKLISTLAEVVQQGMERTKTMRNANHLPNLPEVGAFTASMTFHALSEAIKWDSQKHN